MANKLNNTTAGLAGLLSGVYTGIQNNRANAIAQGQLANQTRTTNWEDPNRPVTELDRVKVNPLLGLQAQQLQQMFNSVPGAQPVVGAAPGVAPTPTAVAPQSTAPVPVVNWATASPDDFLGWQAEMKKRQSKGA